jgi:hypothetical protein
MTRSLKFLLAALAIIAVLDVVAAVQAAQITGPDKPPVFAVIGLVVLAAATLTAAYGLARDTRWARPVIYIACALRIISGILGLGGHTSAARLTLGAVGVVLSVAVIAVLVRTRSQAPASVGVSHQANVG